MPSPVSILTSGSEWERRAIIVNRVIWTLAAIIEFLVLVRILVMLAVGVRANLTGTYGPSQPITDLYAVTGLYVDLFDGATNFVIMPPGQPHAINTSGVLGMICMFFGPLALTKIDLWHARKRDVGEKPILGWIVGLKDAPRRGMELLRGSSSADDDG